MHQTSYSPVFPATQTRAALLTLLSKAERALLKHFGTAKAVSGAGVEDLQVVGGISAAMAQLIYDYFHERLGVGGLSEHMQCQSGGHLGQRLHQEMRRTHPPIGGCDTVKAPVDYRRCRMFSLTAEWLPGRWKSMRPLQRYESADRICW